MHGSAYMWIGGEVERHGLAELSTLEVGSLDVNGSIRSHFRGPYVGIDLEAGPGVDRVMDAHHLDFPPATFDVVVCAEMIEHDPAFWETLSEIGRVLKRSGHLLLTTRGNGFPEHRYPEDYWRFMPDSAKQIAALASCDVAEAAPDPDPTRPGLFIHGVPR